MGEQLSAAPLDTNEQRLSISEIINHPNFNPATFDNDIALIKVSGTFTCGSHVSPACLPNQNVRLEIYQGFLLISCYRVTSMSAGKTP